MSGNDAKVARLAVPESEPAWMQGFFTKMETTVKEQVGSIRIEVQELTTQQRKVVDNIQELTTAQSALQARVEALESKPKEDHGWPSLGTAYAFGARPSPAPSVSSLDTAVPPSRTILKLRNFCGFGEWKTQGVSRAEAETLVNRLKTALPDTLRTAVMEIELRNRLNFEVVIPIASASKSSEILAWWRDLLRDDPEYRFKGRVLYAVPERPPHLKPIYAAMGKLKEKLTQARGGLEPAATWELRDSWLPNWTICARGQDATDYRLVKLNADLSLEWDVTNMNFFFKEESAGLME